MSARMYASSVFWPPLRPTHEFQFEMMRKRIDAPINKTRRGTNRRSPGGKCLTSSGRGLGLAPSDSTSDDLTSSDISVSPRRPSLLLADRLFKFGPCRPVAEQRLLVLVIGLGERRLRLQ